MIREALSALARHEALGGLLNRAPGARSVVRRVVAGETTQDALDVVHDLADRGFWVSLERAAPSVATDEDADLVFADYAALVNRVAMAGLSQSCEVSVFVESLASGDDLAGALERLVPLCELATDSAVAVMVGMGPTADVDATIDLVAVMAGRGLMVGMTLQTCLRRTEADCARYADGRVRLVKGAHRGAPGVCHTQPIEIDKAYVRCAKKLLRGQGQPSFATHDPRLIEILENLAGRYERPKHSYEFAMYMGRMESAQERLAAHGERVRVYVPYGPDWFERLVGGLAEQPSTIVAAVRSLLPGLPS
jgi:proline dehydrogenase